MSPTPDWVLELPQSFARWLESMMDDGPVWGRFRYSVDSKLPYDLHTSGCAVYLIDALNVPFPGATAENFRACAEWVLPLQDEETTFFVDEGMERCLPLEVRESPVQLASFRRAISGKLRNILNRAGVVPRVPVRLGGERGEPDPDPDAFMRKILPLDWDEPWGACSQGSATTAATPSMPASFEQRCTRRWTRLASPRRF